MKQAASTARTPTYDAGAKFGDGRNLSEYISGGTQFRSLTGAPAVALPSLFKLGLTIQCFSLKERTSMQETPQQYTQRMLSNSQGKDPLRLQQATPRKLATLIKRLNKKQLTRRPAPGNGPSPRFLPTWPTRSWSLAIACASSWLRTAPQFRPSTRTPGPRPLTTAAATRRLLWKPSACCARTISGS